MSSAGRPLQNLSARELPSCRLRPATGHVTLPPSGLIGQERQVMAAPRQRPEATRRSGHPDHRSRELTGVQEATNLTFRETTIQTRIADSTRSSPVFASWKDQKSALIALNDVYRAPTDRCSCGEGGARRRHQGETPTHAAASWAPYIEKQVFTRQCPFQQSRRSPLQANYVEFGALAAAKDIFNRATELMESRGFHPFA